MKYHIWTVILFLSFSFLWACSTPEKNDENQQYRIVDRSDSKEKEVKKETLKTKETKEEKTEPIPQEQIDKAKEIIAAVQSQSDEVSAVDAEAKYKMLCANCHGFTGNLNVNGAKDLTKSKLPLEESVAQVYHGKGLMTPFKGVMTETEIVAVCQFIEGLRK